MSFIEIIDTGFISQNDCAFPAIIQLDNSDLICGYNVGGGPDMTGGSDWSRSTDFGRNWIFEGTILPRTSCPVTVNSMRLSKNLDGRIVAYGQRNYPKNGEVKFGTLENEPVFCVSDSECKKWSSEKVIPHSHNCPFEISNPIVVLADGRWLAPAALLPDENHLGEKVVVWESCDKGENWDNEYTVFYDPEGKKGFFEQKIIETSPGNLFAFAWTVELGSYRDLNNHYAYSKDGGKTWSDAVAMPFSGQTLSPHWLGENKFLLLYNFRKSLQGIKLALTEINDNSCRIINEEYLWKPQSQSAGSSKSGIDSFDDFKFGLPSIIRLADGSFIAVFWCFEDGSYVTKWIKLNLNI